MNNTYSDLSSTLPSYSSNGSHAPPPAKLPLGKPGSRVFDTHSTYSEDGGTTSKKALDTTRKVAPVAGTVVALQAAAAKIYGQPGFPACSPDAKEPELRDAPMPDAEAQEPNALPPMLNPHTGLHVRAAENAQSFAKSYVIQKQDEVAILVAVTYPEGHQAVVALSDQTPEGDAGSLDARACTLPSTTFKDSGWTHALLKPAVAQIFPGDPGIQTLCLGLNDPKSFEWNNPAASNHHYVIESSEGATLLIVVSISSEDMKPVTAFASGQTQPPSRFRSPSTTSSRAFFHPGV